MQSCFFRFFFPEVVEHACSVTSLMLGETLPSITKDMDTYTYRLPLGVCAGIAPFNFPAMIPLWMFPMAMVCGNTFLLKPSERVPTCAMLLAKMLQDAGAPDGTLNIIHGQHSSKIWTLETVATVSFRLQKKLSITENVNICFSYLYLCAKMLILSVAGVNFICDHPAIKAISFVGSNQAGEYIYERGSRNGKRVQSNMVSVEEQVTVT